MEDGSSFCGLLRISALYCEKFRIQNFVSFKENQSSEYLSFYNSLCTFRFEIFTMLKVKFILSKKATKFYEIFTINLILTI